MQNRLLISYTTGSIPGENEYLPTFFEQYECTTEIAKEQKKISLWDTAGDEQRGGSMRFLSYPMTDIFLICFPVVSISMETIMERINFYRDEISDTMKNVPFYLVGMKIDLRDDINLIEKCKNEKSIMVKKKEGVAIAQSIGAVKYIECSAKMNIGVKKLFEDAFLYCVNANKPVKF